MTDRPGENAEQLTGIEADRWEAATSAVTGLAEAVADGTADEETVAGAIAQIRAIPLDTTAVLDALHIPDDAGEHAEGLERILRRIPDGWGRWIRCDAGWYPIIIECDEALAKLCPNYEVHQVKEKFGTLRYYFGVPSVPFAECCDQYLTENPRPKRWAADDDHAWKAADDEWHAGFDAHQETEACQEANSALEQQREELSSVHDKMLAVAREFEARAAATCERTGAPGVLMRRHGWYQTLDPAVAGDGWERVDA